MPRVANHLPDLSPLLPIASPLGFLRQKMPGARRGGPKRSQCDSSAAFRGDPTALSVMQRNNPLKLSFAAVTCRRLCSAAQTTRACPCPVIWGAQEQSGCCGTSPHLAWPSVSTPGTAAPPAAQDCRRRLLCSLQAPHPSA